MAVRRQLWELFQDRELFQDQQPVGTIVLERASSPAAAARMPPSPPSSLPPAAEPASPPRRQGPLPELCAVFHCRGCWTVLGDSLQLCAPEEPRLGFLACFKVTSDVIWEDSILIGLEEPLLGCAYNALSCRSCGLSVGFILHSAASDMAHLRGLFCFFKDRILCYLLENKMVIEASKVDFPAVTLKKEVQELKEKLVEFHIRMELLTNKLKELEQSNYVTQWQSSASDTDGLPPGYAGVRIN
ncbi:protein Mis18-beta [Myiozetetes cayanensis]|uniref:protein Mis18-beta n=1 Tax=Myiozetetes cayanensis TaxID=478635 RepID=UPI00215E2917|nr:protein Mis18-beta [Myiozetetes cayanensis]